MTKHLQFKKVLATLLTIAALFVGQQAFASNFTIEGSGNTFIIKRDNTSTIEKVYYRTVSMSALAGVHFTEKSGIATFQVGSDSFSVTVPETAGSSLEPLYHYQDVNNRSYRFEVLDVSGQLLTYKNRSISYGNEYKVPTNYLNSSITDLIYFNSAGNWQSGSGNKYLDVYNTDSQSGYTLVHDGGYSQGVHSIGIAPLFSENNDLKDYFKTILGCNLYATIGFTQKEEQDGYQYIQILPDNYQTYDGNDGNGSVNTPSISLYKACFILSYEPSGSAVTTDHKQFFPHRYNYVNRAAERAAGITHYEFDHDTCHLYQQAYRNTIFDASNSGSLYLPLTIDSLNVRFDAAGSGGDNWYFKNLFARLALLDETAPSLKTAPVLAPGPYNVGSYFYVSVIFREPVKYTTAPKLNTSWGSMSCVGGSGSNVLTFRGTISATHGTALSITGLTGGAISDLAGNAYAGTVSQSFSGATAVANYNFDNATSTLWLNWGPFNKNNKWGSDVNASAVRTVNIPSSASNTMVRFTGDCSELFKDFTICTSFNLANVDVSAMTNAHAMFSGCSSIASLNLSSWDTGKVTDMGSMFSGCSALTQPGITGFNTALVTDMSNMFSGCSSLTTVNVSNWSTAAVTNMSGMFNGCSGITSLNISSWNTYAVTDMNSMFNGCSGLTTLDVSNWNNQSIAAVTDMSNMFNGCSSLASLTVYAWRPNNVTNMSGLFNGCSALTSIAVADWIGGKVTDMSNMFKGCSSLTTLNVSMWNTVLVTNMSGMFEGCSSLQSLDFTAWNTSAVTDMSNMFNGCSRLSTLDVSKWNTANVTNMSGMFKDCSDRTSLNLTNWDTHNVSNMSSMFQNCSELHTIYASTSWSTASVTLSSNMFTGCTALVGGNGTPYSSSYTSKSRARIDKPNEPGYLTGVFTLTLPDDVSVTSAATFTINGIDYYKAGTTVTLAYNGTPPNNTRFDHYTVDGVAIEGNTFTMPFANSEVGVEYLARYTYNGYELSLNWGEFNKDNKWGSDVNISEVTSVTATDEVRFTGDCTDLFKNFTNCTSMDLSNVNTDSLTITFCMFDKCTDLTTLEGVSGWDVSKVTDMTAMFRNCYGLTSLDLSDWNTANVTNMSSMFAGSSWLTTLNLSGWNTEGVTSISYMFDGCSRLTTLNLSNWITAAVTDMSYMFNGCRNLTSLNLTGWDTSNVTDMSGMFYECWSLGSLDISGFNTDNVNNMSNMFNNCSALITLDLSGFNTANVTAMNSMFRNCTTLTTIYAGSEWSTESVTNSNYMFSGCANLHGGMNTTYDADHTNGEYARYDRGEDEPGYLTGVFTLTLPEDVTVITDAALVHGDTNYYLGGHDITLVYTGTPSEGYRFYHFTVGGEPIDGDTFAMPFGTAEVGVEYQGRYTFDTETGVLSLNWGEFNSSSNYKWGSDVIPSAVTSVTATDEVSFTGNCALLFMEFTTCTSMDLSKVNTDSCTNMGSMFSDCRNLASLDLSGWNTANVTNMSEMFYNCSALDTLDLTHFNTGNVTKMNSMFDRCTNLASLDLSGWNTASVTHMGVMFKGCTNLTTIEGLSDFNTVNVTEMGVMFSGCRNLASLDLSGWNTGNVTDMQYMFYGCSTLETLDLSGWNTGNVKNMGSMFDGCSALETLDLSGWNTGNVFEMSNMFSSCTNLTTIYVGEEWSTENVTDSDNMFEGCTSLVGGMGTAYDADHVDGDYSRYDHGDAEPGYLTGVFALTLADDITATPAATLVHDSVNLYAAGHEVTLTYGGDVPEGYAPVYSVNGTAIEGNTFTMPFEDASVTVEIQRLRYIFNSTTGELALIWGEFNKDDKWGDDVPINEVLSVTATNEVSFTGDCTDLFAGFSNCTSIDLSQVNTDNVTNMTGMFAMSAGLETLNLSGWNTANVTNMYSMFATCTSLTTIEGLSDFNTANVTNMNSMFNNCSSLTTLDLSNWNTANVTSMVSMFLQSSGLETINISNWDVSNVTEMATMFLGCSSLESLDIKGWDVGNVTNMGSMIQGCQSLDSLDLSGWNTANVTNMASMFLNCSGLQSLDLSGWDVSKVTNTATMFSGCSSLTSLDISNWIIGSANFDNLFLNCTGLTTLDLSTWNTEDVTNMGAMFINCSNLTTIYAGEGWSAEGVPSNTYMFLGCTNLVGGMGTAYDENHTDVEYARYDKGTNEPGYLTGVFTLTLPGDVIASPDATLTHGDVNLYAAGTTITLSYTGEVPEGYKPVYSVSGTAIEGDSFEMPATDVVVEAVLLERYYIYNSTTGELALIFGAFNKDNKWGSDVNVSAVTSVTATDQVSFTGDCTNLFFGFRNCMSMDLNNVNTDSVINMACMFEDCSSLDTLDLSGWNTEAVTIMSNMFYSCTKLKTLNLTGWDVSHVTNMPAMFIYCHGLTTIEGITQWNPQNVTTMNSMFKYCKSFKSLDLSGWNTESLTDMGAMFMECDSIQTLNLSGWDVSHITSMNGLFWGCKGLETLDVSGWDVSNVTDMGMMFFNCSSLKTLNRSKWNTEKVTDMPAMFYRCSSLETLDLSDWNTENVTNINSMFTYCSNLTTIYVGEGWSTENVTESGGMFFDCTSLVGGMGTTYDPQHTDVEYAHIDGGPDNPGYLSQVPYTYDSESGTLALLYGLFNKDDKWGDDVPAADVLSVTATDQVSFIGDCSQMFKNFSNCTSIDLSQVNTDDCTDMSEMFGNCKAVTTLDLSNWNTANVTNMTYMFAVCQSLESLDVSNWNTASVTDMHGMFIYCSALESLDILNFDIGKVTDMSNMFNSCSGLKSLDLSNWNTAAVTTVNNMFIYCSTLESLDLSGWANSSVTDMTNMFLNCSSLETLDVSNWNTASVTNMSNMFNSCSGLTTLDLSSWNTAAVTTTYAMFVNCSNLTTIYVGEGWNAENVTGSGGMFGNCTSLVGGMGTEYDPDHVNGDYAHIDGGPSNPGYLSAIPLDPVEYIDADGQTAYCQNYTILDGSEDYISYGDNDVEAWYVVDHDVTYSGGIWIYGPANLILVDGATLTINDDTEGNGGYMSSSDRLTIYVQSNGTGAITAVNSSISASGDLIIHGGHITLSSDNDQAYTYMYSSGDMTINGGAISIENGNYHCIYASGQLTINEGTLNAVVTEGYDGYDVIYSEEDVVINGGNITVTNQGYGRGIWGDNVTINGGSVKVYIAHEDDYSGIATDGWGGITLGWTDPSDLIMSEGGYDTYQLSIATGQAFTDGEGNYYFGTYYLYEMPDLAGKTLVPFTNLSETFNITYVTNGGTLPEGYPTTYTFGETVVLPIPTKEDNAFAGWFDNAEFEGYFITEIEAGTALGNKTFYARWKPEYTDVTYLDADGQTQTVRAKVLYGIETELPGGVYTIVDDVYLDKLSFTGNTTIILPDYKYLFVEGMGKGTNDDENGLFVNGNLTIYGQEYGTGLFGSYNVQVSGDVAIYGGSYDIGYLSANNGSGTITLSWTALGSSIRVYVYLGDVVLAKAFMDGDYTIYEAGPVEDVTTINDKMLYPCVTEMEVSYLDQNGVLQTVTATVLYGGEEAEYPGGVYTVLDMVNRGQAYYDRLHFTGDATIIIPDWCSFGVAATKEDNEYWMHVDGNLTIYGQEYGNGQCLFSNVTVNDSVNVYGGWVVLYNISANEINLSWTSIQNEHMVNPTQGTTVNLLKDFMYYDDDNNRHVIKAQQGVDIATIATYYLKPYAETIDVSYIDENGDTHTENATVLFGDETSLRGGTYTIIDDISFSQAVSFSGDTKLIVPDGTYFYGYTQDYSFFEGEVINVNVNGDLAIYGQENRSGTVLYINASVSGAVTVSNVRVIYSFINSESDILIAGGEHEYGQLSANGTITLGYLTFNDRIYCNDYEGTVAIRAGQAMEHWGTPYMGTLTAEEVAAIAGMELYPYIEPITLEIAGYGDDDNPGGWYLIATPIPNVDPITIEGMITNPASNYDLYAFDQSSVGGEWRNYKAGSFDVLESGKGYLYANKNDVELVFTGIPYSGNGVVELDYDEDADLVGWNLVGNPFGVPAYFADGRDDFYEMNSDGTGFTMASTSEIAPMQGVFVVATGEGETVQFVTERPENTGKSVTLRLGNGRSANIDAVRVRFEDGRNMGKLVLNENATKLYIPQNGEDYSVVASEAEGQMPVNFKAAANGMYTLNAETNNAKFSYLHLIDNLTGADVDLLANPSYSFNATTSDYAARFSLVFAENTGVGENSDAQFAFISDGNIIVNGEGTLEMVDLTGRVIVSRSGNVSGNISTNGIVPGVYVLRLINGNSVMTQKMVIQ